MDDSAAVGNTAETEAPVPLQQFEERQNTTTASTANNGDDNKPRQKRWSHQRFLVDMINNIDLGEMKHRKKPSELQCQESLRIRRDEGLAYLIKNCEYNDPLRKTKI